MEKEHINRSFFFHDSDKDNIVYMRSLVKQYSELGQWGSALFWADAAAAASVSGDTTSGDDIWLLASAMLARGELHRAAYAVTYRELHKRHLLCLGVAMRAYIAAREPDAALSLLDECDPALLEPRTSEETHNRALASVFVWQARALSALERREAASEALTGALRADCACYEALDLLLEQHALSPRQERELVDSLPYGTQLNPVQGKLLKTAYRERLNRYNVHIDAEEEKLNGEHLELACVRLRTLEARCARGRALAAACAWSAALQVLDSADPWCCPDVRTACLVELRRSSDLFAFAHALVDAYPQNWTSWYAVGCYYYLIGKSEFARRYLSKAKSLDSGAGCIWLAYGHSFAADNEHDQAMAAYFKASQLMGGCHLPPLYVAVECSLLNNVAMCERFLLRAASLHSNYESGNEPGMCDSCGSVCMCESGGGGGGGGEGSMWERVARCVRDAHVAHEAGAGAYAAGEYEAARMLWMRTLALLKDSTCTHPQQQRAVRWAATLDGLGHACRKLGWYEEALEWHARALALRPRRAASLCARALCLALLGRERDAADATHAALAADPDDAVALGLLDTIVDKLDTTLTEEEIPQFPFPPVQITVPPVETEAPVAEMTNNSDMSMSFD